MGPIAALCALAGPAVAAPGADYGATIATIPSSWPANSVLFADDGAAVIQGVTRFHCFAGSAYTELTDATYLFAARAGRADGVVLGGTILDGGRLGQSVHLARCGAPTSPLPGIVEVPDGLGPSVPIGQIEPSDQALRWVSTGQVIRAELMPAGDGLARVWVSRASLASVLPDSPAPALVFVHRWTVATDGTMYLIVTDSPAGAGDEPLHYVVEVSNDATPTLRAGPFTGVTPPSVSWLPALDAVVLSAAGPELPLRVIYRDHTPAEAPGLLGIAMLRPDADELATAEFAESFTAVVPATTGTVAVTVQSGSGDRLVRPLVVAPTVLDLDRDGLTRAQEQALGTSDRSRDSDGDGFEDRVEHEGGTSPIDAASVPPTMPFDPTAVLAGSAGIMIDEHDFVTPDTPRSGFSRWLCQGDTCLHADRTERPGLPHAALYAMDDTHVYEIPDVSAGTDTSTAPRVIHRWDTPAALGVPMTMPPLPMLSLIPISDTEALVVLFDPVPTPLGIRTLIARIDGPDVTILLDSATACAPMAAARPCGVGLVTWDHVQQRMLAQVWASEAGNYDRRWVFELGETARYLAEITDVVGVGSHVTSMTALDTGGFVVQRINGNASHELQVRMEPIRIDPSFRTATRHPPLGAIDPFLGGQPFRDGYYGNDAKYFELPPYQEGDSSSGCRFDVCWTMPSSAGFIMKPQPKTVWSQTEWRTKTDALQPGDVVGFSQTTFRDNDTFSDLPVDSTTAAVVRITADLTVVPWIDRARMATLIRPQDAGTLFLPVDQEGIVRSLDVSPDRSRICLADGLRVWEIELTDGVPTSMGVAAADAGEACAYREDGALAVVAASPRALRVAGTTVTLLDEAPVGELRRIDGRWVLARGRAASLCIGDDGRTIEAPAAAALAAAFGGVLWIPEDGIGYIARSVDAFCAGQAAERLEDDDVWGAIYENSLSARYAVSVTSASIAVRPDGLILTQPRGVNLVEAYGELPVPLLLMRWFPSYRAVDGVGIAAVDPLRRVYPGTYALGGYEVMTLSSVTALDFVDGAPAGTDWGYDDREGEPYVPEPEPGSDGGPGAPPAEPSGCCGAGGGGAAPSAAACALVVLLSGRRRRRASSTTRGDGGAEARS